MKTQRALVKQIKKPEFLIGFEIEGAIEIAKREEYRKALDNIYGRGKWIWDSDGSLEFEDEELPPEILVNDCWGEDIIETVEFKTPPLPEKEAFQKAFNIFEELNKIGFFTNKSCGFHVNISEKNLFKHRARINFIEYEDMNEISFSASVHKLCKFCWYFTNDLKPSFWLKMFNRSRNLYCSWGKSYSKIFDDKNYLRVLDYEFNCDLDRGAINTSNIESSAKKRRIEIRIAGNKDYTKKFDLLNKYFEAIRSSMYKAYNFASV